jgi:hypothetical protein
VYYNNLCVSIVFVLQFAAMTTPPLATCDTRCGEKAEDLMNAGMHMLHAPDKVIATKTTPVSKPSSKSATRQLPHRLLHE